MSSGGVISWRRLGFLERQNARIYGEAYRTAAQCVDPNNLLLGFRVTVGHTLGFMV
jgi:hypothetical protein